MNEEKMTLKESVRLTLRAWCFYWKNTPRFVLSTVLWALADAVSPYAVVWFSARLVAELSDARDPQALAVDVAWVLGVTALLTLVRSVLLHWKSVEREQLNWQLGHDCFMEKQMSMDYADEDSQQVYDLYNFIQQSESFCSGGNPNAVALLDSVSAAVFRILGGAVLSVGLFTARVPAGPQGEIRHPECHGQRRFGSAHGSCLPLCMPEGLRRGLWSGRCDPVCGRSHQLFCGHRRAVHRRGRLQIQRPLPENAL